MSLNSVSEDVRTMLNDGLKGVSGTDLFSFQWGSGADGVEIDKQILVVDEGVIDSLLKEQYENPTINIFVRGGTSEGLKAVHDRARDIYEYMISQVRQIINGTEYVEFEPVGGLNALGKDENNRAVYLMNFYTFRNSI